MSIYSDTVMHHVTIKEVHGTLLLHIFLILCTCIQPIDATFMIYRVAQKKWNSILPTIYVDAMTGISVWGIKLLLSKMIPRSAILVQ